jgi:carboxymethylenebutenolidase
MAAHRRRPTAGDFHPEVLRLFDRYVHGALDRRGFLDGAAKFAAGSGGAAALLAALSPDFAAGERSRAVRASAPTRSGSRRRKATAAAAAYSCGRPGAAPRPAQTRAAFRLSSRSTRTAASIRTSRMSRASLANFIAFARRAVPIGGSYIEDKRPDLFGRLDQS